MAITFVGSSVVRGATASPTIPAVAGTLSGDLIILTVHSANEVIATPAGFTAVSGSPQGTGTAAAIGAVRCAVFYMFLTAPDVALVLADSGSVTVGVKTAYRGVDTVSPIAASAGSVQATATTAMVWPGVTTPVDGCMIVLSCAQDMDISSSATSGTLTNANLTGITERADDTVTSGVGGGVVVNTGTKAVAGATGTSTSTSSSSVTHAYVTIALRPVATILGSLVKTEAPDTVTASGFTTTPPILGSLVKTEAPDTVVSTGSLPVSAVVSATEGADTVAAAALVPLAPQTYYVDLEAGNDSNSGLSWAAAVKTCMPFNRKTIVLRDTDSIQISRNDHVELVADGTYALGNTGVLEAGTYGSNSFLRSTFLTLTAPLTGYFRSVSTVGSGTWVVVAGGGRVAYSQSSTGELAWCSFANTLGKLAYQTLGATVSLSGFPRLEMLTHFLWTASAVLGTVPATYRLDLCSDAVGDVPLLSIPLTTTNLGGVFAYEGVLPDGINSIAVHCTALSSPVTSCVLHCKSLVATQLLSSPTYLGHHSVAKIGTHEAALWCRVDGFNGTAVGVSWIPVGKFTDHATPKTLRFRKAASWSGLEAGQHTTTFNSSGEYPQATDQHDLAIQKVWPLFHFDGIAAPTGITITGGYDPGSGLVVGVTHLQHRAPVHMSSDVSKNSMIGVHTPAAGTRLHFKNLSLVSEDSWVLSYSGSHLRDFTMTDCELSVAYASISAVPTRRSLTATYTSGTIPELVGCRLTRCKGYVFLQSTAGSVLDLSSCTLEECIAAPNSQGAGYNYPSPKTATLVYDVEGFLKVYGVDGRSALPVITSGTTAPVYLYNSGITEFPAFTTNSHPVADYVYPPLVLEHAFPYFIFASGSGYGGPVRSITLPSVQMTLSTVLRTAGAASAGNDYPVYVFSTYDNGHTPIQVNNVTVTALSAVPYAGSLNRTLLIGALYNAAFGINHLTVAPGILRLIISTQVDVSNSAGRLLALNDLQIPGIPLTSTLQVLSDCNFDISLTNSSISVAAPGAWQLSGSLGGTVRIQGCSITNDNGTPFIPDYSLYWHQPANNVRGSWGDRAALYLKDNTFSTANIVSSMYVSPADDLATGKGRPTPVTIIDTGAGTHITYNSQHSLEVDSTIKRTGSHSWKSTLRRYSQFPMTSYHPLGSVPVKAGSNLTISLSVRRGTTASNYIGLMVFPKATSGQTPTDYLEKVSIADGAAGVWETVDISYYVVRSGIIDIHVTHHGAVGSVGWFDNLTVIES